MDVGDEYDEYDFSEFTEDDFAQIDANIALHYQPLETQPTTVGNGSAGPRTPIEIERHADLVATKEHRILDMLVAQKAASPSRKPQSPFKQFRKWGQTLSVTDLVGPAW